MQYDEDVVADLRGAIAAPKVKHFAAITEAWEVGQMLRAIDGYSGHKFTIIAMRLSPHVLLRPGKLTRAEWTDIDFNEAIWSIPAERMKMRRPRRVPLSRQMIAMLKEPHEHTHWWEYLVPCLGKHADVWGRSGLLVSSRGPRCAVFILSKTLVIASARLFDPLPRNALTRRHTNGAIQPDNFAVQHGVADDAFD